MRGPGADVARGRSGGGHPDRAVVLRRFPRLRPDRSRRPELYGPDLLFDRASNALCGDPEPGVVKRLRVVFRCGRQGADRTVEAIEHTAPLEIACTALQIQAVAYGGQEAFCDATAPVASQCNREERCSIAVANGLCGDPLPGVAKVAHITFKCNGQQRFLTAPEHTSVTLDCR